ncbi:MAG: hypothetical protein KY459_04875 [Acidobacteria bacterium]|nr:hypothetical protein [Acidobacteriota bacterium]
MKTSRIRFRHPLQFFALILLIGLNACVTDPLTESIDIEMLSDEEARVSVTVEIEPVDPETRPAAAASTTALANALADETDQWSRRFAAVNPYREQRTWTRTEGVLTKVQHSAVLDPREIGLFFGDTSISVFVTGGEDWREISIYPGTSNGASVEQQRALERRMTVWLQSVSRYYGAVARIYEYIEAHPHRTRDVVSAMFAIDAILTETERILLDEFEIELDELIGLFSVSEDESLSLQRVSQLVYDPLPASLRISVDGDVLLHEGVEEQDDGSFVVPRVGLWEAFAALEGRWITPDPLTVFLRMAEEDEARDEDESEEDPLAAFLEQPRWVHSVPQSEEIRDALMEELRPEPVYRVRWRPEEEE